MNISKNTMLQYMELCDWPQKHIQSFARFYFHLELDPMHSCPNGEQVLLAYQVKVQHQWHEDIAQGQGFNISQINQKLLATIAEEVWDAVHLEAIKKVSNPSPLFCEHCLTFSTLFLLLPSLCTIVNSLLPPPCHACANCQPHAKNCQLPCHIKPKLPRHIIHHA